MVRYPKEQPKLKPLFPTQTNIQEEEYNKFMFAQKTANNWRKTVNQQTTLGLINQAKKQQQQKMSHIISEQQQNQLKKIYTNQSILFNQAKPQKKSSPPSKKRFQAYNTYKSNQIPVVRKYITPKQEKGSSKKSKTLPQLNQMKSHQLPSANYQKMPRIKIKSTKKKEIKDFQQKSKQQRKLKQKKSSKRNYNKFDIQINHNINLIINNQDIDYNMIQNLTNSKQQTWNTSSNKKSFYNSHSSKGKRSYPVKNVNSLQKQQNDIKRITKSYDLNRYNVRGNKKRSRKNKYSNQAQVQYQRNGRVLSLNDNQTHSQKKRKTKSKGKRRLNDLNSVGNQGLKVSHKNRRFQ